MANINFGALNNALKVKLGLTPKTGKSPERQEFETIISDYKLGNGDSKGHGHQFGVDYTNKEDMPTPDKNVTNNEASDVNIEHPGERPGPNDFRTNV